MTDSFNSKKTSHSSIEALRGRLGIDEGAQVSVSVLLKSEHDRQLNLLNMLHLDSEALSYPLEMIDQLALFLSPLFTAKHKHFLHLRQNMIEYDQLVTHLLDLSQVHHSIKIATQNVLVQLRMSENELDFAQDQFYTKLSNGLEAASSSWYLLFQDSSRSNPKFIMNLARECLKQGCSLNYPLIHKDLWVDWKSLFGANAFVYEEEVWRLFSEAFKLVTTDWKDSYIQSIIEFILPHKPNLENQKILATRFKFIIDKFELTEWIHKPFFEHCDLALGKPPNWQRWSFVSDELKERYQVLRGYIKYRYFEQVSRIVYQEFRTGNAEDQLLRQMNSRTIFWSNYRLSIKEIYIFLPKLFYDRIHSKKSFQYGEKLSFTLSKDFKNSIFLSNHITVPVCIMIFDSCIVIEYFQGSGQDSFIIADETLSHKLYKSPDIQEEQIDSLIQLATCRIHHNSTWMYLSKHHLSGQLDIIPDTRTHFYIPKFDLNNPETFGQRIKRTHNEMHQYYEEQKRPPRPTPDAITYLDSS